MNFKKTFLVILASAIITFSSVGKYSHATESTAKMLKASISTFEKSENEYTYVSVFKDGIWWIYVYDGNILIDAFPED